MIYKNKNIEINQEAQAILDRKKKENKNFIFKFLSYVALGMAAFVAFPALITVCIGYKKKGFLVTCFCVLFIEILILAIIIGIGTLFAKLQSKKRFKYLPLNEQAMKKFEITSIYNYCDFLNEFLCVTPFGKRASNNSIIFKTAQVPEELLNKINNNFNEHLIAWDDYYENYYVI